MTPISYAPLTFPALALLPANATPWETAMSLTSSRILDTDTQAVRRERDPLQCDPAFLPFLGWERSVHYWSATDAAGNAARAASSFPDHLSYGAPSALEAEIALDTGQTIRVVEFFEEPDLVFPQFVVESVISPGDPVPDLAAMNGSALRRKNVRDDLAAVRLRGSQPAASIYIGAAARVSPNVKVLPAPPSVPPLLSIGAATRVFPYARILPEAP